MTLNQLRYFVKVAENGHLTRSAAELMIAQPSLSQAIGKLEKELGFPLFSSKGRTLILTKEGQIFLPYAKNVLLSGEQAQAGFEVIGPIGPFNVTVAGVTKSFPAVAEKKTLRCPAGQFPAFGGMVPVTVRAEDPAYAPATFAFVKRYRTE